MNVVVLRGRTARPAEQRLLPSGDRLLALEVTVAREGEKAESVPVVWFEAPAAASFDADQEVVVVGRVRRRFFRTGGATQSRTEVVAEVVLPARQARRVETALARAREALSGGSERAPVAAG